jgi:phage tail-like protein
MAEFPVNPTRHDPYKQFKFRVKWDGQYVAAVSHISGLRRRTEVIQHREGGDPSTSRRSPGATTFEPVVLSRGVTQDHAFEEWASKVARLGQTPEASPTHMRKDVLVELRNEAGQIVLAWKLYRCWPSEYVALEALDANGATVAIESITLQCEGWERDTGVTEPVEP